MFDSLSRERCQQLYRAPSIASTAVSAAEGEHIPPHGNPRRQTTDRLSTAMEEADVVIIGAGTAGCVLANRLSADPGVSVLVLEAGEDRSDDARMYTPAKAREMLGNESFDWGFESEVEPGLAPFPSNAGTAAAASVKDGNPMVTQPIDGFGAEARDGRRMKHPRGKVVGGSSAINSFALIYPSVEEIDTWAELGNKGWDWEGTKTYFRRFQTLVPPDKKAIDELNLAHNFGGGSGIGNGDGEGPIQASFPETVSPMQRAWLEGFRALALENENDPLEGKALGGGITAVHIHGEKRERSHAGVAYLDPVRGRENLKVVIGASVQRLEFEKRVDGADARARSVLFEKDGEVREIKVKREVILAAGAFGSPQLLELSGIGEAKRLNALGIDVVYENASVGENLQDHIRGGLSFDPIEGIGAFPPMTKEEAEKLYVDSRSGPWAEDAAYMFAYMPLVPFCSPADKQQLEQLCHEYQNEPDLSPYERAHRAFVTHTILSPTEASATAYFIRALAAPISMPGLEQGKCITISAMLSHPLSRGSVHITSTYPAVKPEVRFNYYTHPLDLEIHARHLLSLQTLAATPPITSLLKPNGVRYPPKTLTLETAKQYLREHATTNYHPCGTCAMLPEAEGGVVDERLRVYGTGNVRVVDASVLPVIPRGNIIGTVYAVAEKGAEIVGEDLGRGRWGGGEEEGRGRGGDGEVLQYV